MTTHHSTRRSAIFACGLLLLLAAVLCGLTWHAWRQEKLDGELIAAVKRRDTFATCSLLRHGANANTQNRKPQSRSLWHYLLTSLHRQQPTNTHRQTALLLAVQGLPSEGPPPENVPLVQALLDAGATLNATDESGMTALMSAAADGHLATVKLLLAKGADTRPRDKDSTLTMTDLGRTYRVPMAGRTALQYAFEMNDDPAIMRVLLDHGADVNVRDGYEQTLLISAAGEGAVNKVRLLLSYHPDLSLSDKWKRTALLQARTNGYTDIVKLLQHAGAHE